jgi:hypothetical protein
MRIVTLVLGLALLGTLASAAEPDPAFVAAMREAEGNAKTPEGAPYDEAFGRTFAQKHEKILGECAKSLDASEMSSFDILARVTATGKLETVLVEPRTKLAECLRKNAVDHGYPGPPRPHYWVNVRMNIHQ